MNLGRAHHLLAWAERTFGNIALDPRERAMRFFEEACELAQSCRVGNMELRAILERVLSREPGNPGREFGQTLTTLELLALVANCDMDREASDEMHRVMTIPQYEWDRRHAAKVALGIATPSDRPGIVIGCQACGTILKYHGEPHDCTA